MNAEVYYLSEVPIQLNLFHIILLNVGTMFVCIGALIIPSMVISRIQPAKSIKFNLRKDTRFEDKIIYHSTRNNAIDSWIKRIFFHPQTPNFKMFGQLDKALNARKKAPPANTAIIPQTPNKKQRLGENDFEFKNLKSNRWKHYGGISSSILTI